MFIESLHILIIFLILLVENRTSYLFNYFSIVDFFLYKTTLNNGLKLNI